MNCNPEPLVLKKRQKVRSAWISFAGRIAAQLIGAVATVGLGVVVLHKGLPAAAFAAPVAHEQSVLVAKPVRTEQGTVIVLVPLDRYDEVTAETVETVSRAFATHLSQTAVGASLGSDPSKTPARSQTPLTPMLAAANAH